MGSVKIISSDKILGVVGSGLFLLYVTVGLGLSGVESISGLAFLAAFLGCALVLFRIGKALSALFPFLVSVLYIGFSWLWARDAALGVLGSYLTAVLGGLLFYGLVKARWITIETAFLVLLTPLFINFYAYLVGDNLTGTFFGVEDETAFKRFGGYVGHPSPLTTRLVAPLFAFAMLGYAIKSRAIYIAFLVLVLFSAFFAVYATGSKKSLLLIIPILPLLLKEIAMKLRGKRGVSNKSILILLFFVFAVLAVKLLSGLSMFVDDLEVLNRFDEFILGGDESTDERHLLLLLAPSLIEDAPFFGYGLDQFAVVTGRGMYSHNNMVELLVNTGVVGFLVYYFSVAYAMSRIWRQSGGGLVVMSVLLIMLILDLTGVTYGDRGSQIIMAAILLKAFVYTKNGGVNGYSGR